MSVRCRSCAPIAPEIRLAAELLERRYALSILCASRAGAVRFNEFLQALGPVPPRTLSVRLSELAAAGILERAVIDSRPPRVEYRLTRRGNVLQALVDALERFSRTFPSTTATEEP